MKLDPWIMFNLSREDQQLFHAFVSPDTDRSVLKDIPINALDQVRPVINRVERLTGQQMRVIYRGPRNRYHGQSSTLKQDATRFAVYFR